MVLVTTLLQYRNLCTKIHMPLYTVQTVYEFAHLLSVLQYCENDSLYLASI